MYLHKAGYCTVLYSTVLYCTVLYCTVLCMYCTDLVRALMPRPPASPSQLAASTVLVWVSSSAGIEIDLYSFWCPGG